MERMGSGIVWKAMARGAGFSATLGFPLVLAGRGYKRLIFGALAVMLVWALLLPFGIQVR